MLRLPLLLAAVRKKAVFLVGPQRLVEHGKTLLRAGADHRVPALLDRLFQQKRQRGFHALPGQVIEQHLRHGAQPS